MSSTDPTKILGYNQGARERLVAPVFYHTHVVLLVVKSIIIVSTNQTDYGDESFWHIYHLSSSNLALKMSVI
jgi:hypothetical protein